MIVLGKEINQQSWSSILHLLIISSTYPHSVMFGAEISYPRTEHFIFCKKSNEYKALCYQYRRKEKLNPNLYQKTSRKHPAFLEVISCPLVQVFDGQACSQQPWQHSLILEWLSWWELGNCSLLCLSPHLLSAQSRCQQWSEEAKRRLVSIERHVGSKRPQQL